MKKLGLMVMSLATTGLMSFGLSINPETQQTAQADNINKLQSTHGEGWSPQRPDLALNIGDTWSPSYAHGDTGIASNKAEDDTPAPAYTHGQPWGVADGNTGSPAYDHGRPPAPTNTHGETII
ncbi:MULTISPECIES: hypothetical protein [Bacillus]|uniref:hypothetical protein n=1 Tax=Bacillus TaxID=1386 RepID=UPI00032FA794|nr:MULTISPECIES: hypothetical protein [Bacillus cereus group]EOP60998.1 hypothetical protein IIW_04691 [Bacillus cereus VD136]EOP76111.1 hypothetical protein KOW_04432 [Bacillus cereus VDM006]EOQ15777.1 hypothetical protein KOY_03560 [Bacillus cereus VDM021]OOG90277.1 hypothetical protein BTH41_03340 [Bacillus mycoides]PEK67688.1 hypothetical protein CN590_13985 [Bacillus pseudomycoides]